MKVCVACVLKCPPEKVWDEVQKSALLLEVIHPVVRLAPVGPPRFPDRWAEGTTSGPGRTCSDSSRSGRELYWRSVDQAAHEIQSRESDPLIRRWDHLIRVKPAAHGWTHYSDEIVIEAGVLTPLVWLFAQWFYRHRQRRWRQVAKRLAP